MTENSSVSSVIFEWKWLTYKLCQFYLRIFKEIPKQTHTNHAKTFTHFQKKHIS